MDKAVVLNRFRSSKNLSTFLGGELPASVVNTNKYIHAVTAEAQDSHLPRLDHAVLAALSDEPRCVALIGPEGSGKTTALQKLVMDWAKGECLQGFSFIFHFNFWEISSLEGAFSFETLIQHSHHYIPPKSMPLVVKKPEEVLFVIDGLDQYKHSLNPSVHTLCSDISQVAPVPCLVASLLHRSLLRGAAFVVATRPTGNLKFLSATQVEALGFLKPQREAYFNSFFTDPAAANKALLHMERTLGFYDLCASPRFCWTVCSIYKCLMDSGADLPETLSQLFVDILVHLIERLALSEARNRALVLALGRMASHCLLDQHSNCTKEQIESFGFEQFLDSADVFLHIDGELELDKCTFSFHSQLIQEFILALAFFLDKSTHEGLEKMLEKHEAGAKFLDFFLSGLSEPVQNKRLETLVGELSSEQIKDFRSWFKSSSKKTLEGFDKDKHYRCFHLLHQAQNENLVKEIVTPSARLGYGHSNLSLQDCVALSYFVTCLGDMETLSLHNTRILTDKAEVLASAFSLSHEISLLQNSFSTGAILHLASALNKGVTSGLFLSNSHLIDEQFKLLCAGLKDSKLQKLNLEACQLTRTCCEDLLPVLTSETSEMRKLVLRFNPIEDEGFAKLCTALQSPHCRLQELDLQNCDLTSASMEAFAVALCSGQSQLRKVDLRNNEIGDSGMEAVCKSLQHPVCKLQSLILFDNDLTGACCSSLLEAFMSEHFFLSELNLALNDLGQEGALLLCQGLSQPGCPIKSLNLTRCELTVAVFKELGSLLKNGTCKLKSLIVGINNVGDQGVRHLWDAVAHPSCLLEELDVEMTGVTDACISDLCAAVRASKTLKKLELRNNSLTDASIPALIQVVEDSDSVQEINLRYNDIGEEFIGSCDKIIF